MFDLQNKMNAKEHRSTVLSVFAFFVLLLAVSFSAWAQADSVSGADQKSEEQSSQDATVTSDDHLIVPIFPRGQKPKNTEDLSSLKDSYIVMQDGSVLSVADWVLGSLNKSNIRAGMSDYENRLFLGQVARAAAGLDEEMVLHSFRHAGPPRDYTPHTPPEVLQIAQGYLSMLIPALSPNWTPAVDSNAPKLGNGLERGFTGTILFENQFSDALNQTAEEFSYNGTIFTMLKEAAQQKPQD